MHAFPFLSITPFIVLIQSNGSERSAMACLVTELYVWQGKAYLLEIESLIVRRCIMLDRFLHDVASSLDHKKQSVIRKRVILFSASSACFYIYIITYNVPLLPLFPNVDMDHYEGHSASISSRKNANKNEERIEPPAIRFSQVVSHNACPNHNKRQGRPLHCCLHVSLSHQALYLCLPSVSLW